MTIEDFCKSVESPVVQWTVGNVRFGALAQDFHADGLVGYVDGGGVWLWDGSGDPRDHKGEELHNVKAFGDEDYFLMLTRKKRCGSL